MFCGSIPIGHYLAASLVDSATGTAISVLLLVLTVRSARLPGTAAGNIVFVICGLAWNVGGHALSVALTFGVPEQGRTMLIILVGQFTAAAAVETVIEFALIIALLSGSISAS